MASPYGDYADGHTVICKKNAVEPLAKLSFQSLRLPAQTLRYVQNIILGGKHPSGMNFDSDISYMPVVKFFACLDFE
jgi:hypothetical protein